MLGVPRKGVGGICRERVYSRMVRGCSTGRQQRGCSAYSAPAQQPSASVWPSVCHGSTTLCSGAAAPARPAAEAELEAPQELELEEARSRRSTCSPPPAATTTAASPRMHGLMLTWCARAWKRVCATSRSARPPDAPPSVAAAAKCTAHESRAATNALRPPGGSATTSCRTLARSGSRQMATRAPSPRLTDRSATSPRPSPCACTTEPSRQAHTALPAKAGSPSPCGGCAIVRLLFRTPIDGSMSTASGSSLRAGSTSLRKCCTAGTMVSAAARGCSR